MNPVPLPPCTRPPPAGCSSLVDSIRCVYRTVPHRCVRPIFSGFNGAVLALRSFTTCAAARRA
jgi:hypothetical protein